MPLLELCSSIASCAERIHTCSKVTFLLLVFLASQPLDENFRLGLAHPFLWLFLATALGQHLGLIHHSSQETLGMCSSQ